VQTTLEQLGLEGRFLLSRRERVAHQHNPIPEIVDTRMFIVVGMMFRAVASATTIVVGWVRMRQTAVEAILR